MAPPSIQPVSAATVRILDARGGRAGQGLAVSLPGARTLILTCHHVVLQSGDAQQVAIELFDELDAPRGRILARLDEARSDPRHDLAVLIPLAELAVAPVRLARLASRYGGPLRVEGVTREPEDSQRFNATLAAPTRLDLQDPLFTGSIPVAFRLTEVSDVKRGVSGSPVAAAGAVVGLTHFSRGETADSARESYVVPITAWFARNPELAAISRPFVDPALSQVAIVKIGADLDPAGDFELPPYPYETILERAELRDAEKALQSHRRCLILGRPGSGKTWMAWQLARKSAGVVVMPRANRPPEQFDTSALLESGLTLLIDAAELRDSGFAFEDWYRRLANPDGLPPSLLVTSRDDRDWQGVRQRFPRLAAVLDPRNSRQTVYASATPAGGSDIDLERAREFAEQIGLNAAQFQHFDGTIGSLIAPTGDMAARYESLREERFGEATGSLLLDALKTLRLLHLELSEAMARRIAAIALGQEPSESLWRELKRLTAQAGFGRFDEQGFFRGYKVYLEQSVTYVPSMDDFHRFAAVLPEGPDDTPLVSAGIKLLQYGDDRGMEFLGAAIAKGSKPAILTAVLTMSEVRSYLPAAIRVAHELVRREPADYYGLLGALYRRWGKRKWAIRAYRAAMDAGDEEAGSSLGALLLEDERTAEEGKTRLREAIRRDVSGMDAVALAGHLIDEIGAEVEAEKLLRQGNAAASPMARILLGSLYSAWPGHSQQAKELLEPIATDTSSAFARPLALMACEILRQAAGARGEDAEVRRWSSESGRIGAITQNAYEIFRSTSAPTTFREGHRESRRGPHTGASIAVSESRMVLAVPSMKRFTLLNDGWTEAWTPDDRKLAILMAGFAVYEHSGYAQAALISGVGLYRQGKCEEAERSVRKALANWNTPDHLFARGKLLLAGILTELERIDEAADVIDRAVDAVSERAPESAREIGRAAARDLRRRTADGAGAHNGGRVHQYLAAVWLALEEWGPAWFENRKWLAMAEGAIGAGAFVSRGTALPPEEFTGFRDAAARVRDGEPAQVTVAGFQPPPVFTVQPEGGRVYLSGSWAGLVPDGSEEMFHRAALILSKSMVDAAWNANGPPGFRMVLPLAQDALDAAELGVTLRQVAKRLDQARRILTSGSGATTFLVHEEEDGTVIDFSFDETEPAEAVRHLKGELHRKDGGDPILKAEIQSRLAASYLAMPEGSRRENVEAAIQAYQSALELLDPQKQKWQWGNVQADLGKAWLESEAYREDAGLQAMECFDAALKIHRRSVDARRWGVLMVHKARAARTAGYPKKGVDEAIHTCQAGLAVLNEVNDCYDWAQAQEELGLGYTWQAREQGLRGRGRAKQIAAAQECFRAALRVHTRSGSPYRWAALHSVLGDTNLLAEGDDRREPTARAIEELQSALEVFTEAQYPWDWALVQTKVVQVHLQQRAWLPESAAEAIATAEAALRVYSKEASPAQWASLQYALGSAYTSLRGMAPREALERAIHHYKAAATVDSRLRENPAVKAEWAKNLGFALKSQGAYDPASLAEAIGYLNESLEFYRKDTLPAVWGDLHYTIGMAYLDLESGARAANLRKALHHVSLCLEAVTRQKLPLGWAWAQEGLGRIHLARFEFVPGDLGQAFQALQSALEEFTREKNEFRWAAGQDYLGRCYAALQTGKRHENIATAMRHFRNSLEGFTGKEHADDRAVVLEQLVYALLDSAVEEGQAAVEEAIGAAREGLELVSKEDNPRRWGALEDGLGVAFRMSEKGVPAANIANGIALQMLALEVYPEDRLPVDYAIVQMHLGFSHVAQAQVSDYDEIRELALRNFGDAARILTREHAPRRWALIQNGMGCASCRPGSLERAVAFHRAALEVLTPSTFPEDHAGVQLDLAKTLLRFESADARREAAQGFRAALAYFSAEGFPRKRAQIEEMVRAAGMVLDGDEPGAR